MTDEADREPATGPRILVSLDPAITAAEEWLQRALAAAARSGAEVVAVTVSETRYRDLASFAFVQELDRGFGTARPLDPGRLERAARARARRLRERFEALARSHAVRWRLEERTGSYPGEVIRGSREYTQVVFAGSAMVVRQPGSARPRRRRRIVVLGRDPGELETLVAVAREYAGEEREIAAGLISAKPGTGALTAGGIRAVPVRAEDPLALAAFVRANDGGLLIASRGLVDDLAYRLTELWEVADFPIVLVG